METTKALCAVKSCSLVMKNMDYLSATSTRSVEKGHTFMIADSIHSSIGKKLQTLSVTLYTYLDMTYLHYK